MIQEILALSWITIFLFGLKFITAWICAAIVVALPLAILKAIFD